MTQSPLFPGAADALLFDLGRVVIDIDFNKTLACWAGHAGCEVAHLKARFSPDQTFRRHEIGEISDAVVPRGPRGTAKAKLLEVES